MSKRKGSCMDPIKRNKETEITKNKLLTYLIEALTCFCEDVNNKKINTWDNGSNHDNGDNTNDNSNSNSNNNDNNVNIGLDLKN